MRSFRRGSVMMEMIVVFPIYLVLFGGLFMLGDMLIKAARLPSAERTTAFDLGRESPSEEGWNAVRNLLFANSDTDDLHKEEISEYYADTAVQGPFSLRAAVKIRNDYKMPSGIARGQLQFADWFFARSTPNGAEMATGDNSMGDLINGNGGPVEMYSKTNSFDRTKITYNYYTLRRRRYNEGKVEDGGEGWTWRSNARPAADLMVNNNGTQHWLDVAGENWHGTVGNESGNRDALKGLNGTRNDVKYTRYPQFVTWSD